MKLIKVIYPETNKLEEFLSIAGNSLSTFRYFEKRPISIIQNHRVTYLLLDENKKPVSYGHLDNENETIWLGIAVPENQKGKGFGKIMMHKLITFAQKNKIHKVKLSVDNINVIAINLYLNFGFTITTQTEKITFMKIAIQ